MEHLIRAMEKLEKRFGLRFSKPVLGDMYKYLSTGDQRLLPGLLRIDEPGMNSLCSVASAVARPDKWGDADLRLIEFFARRSALLNGTDKGLPQGECSDWPLAPCLEHHLEVEKPDEDFCRHASRTYAKPVFCCSFPWAATGRGRRCAII